MIAAAALAAVATAASASAAAVDERVGQRVPLDLPFHEAGGGEVTLGDHVRGDKPVVLVMAYARCTMLCSVVLRGVVEVARRVPLEPGDDYRLVLVSLDPRETTDEAARKQAALVADLGHSGEAWRWPYLTGEPAEVEALADALGFRYAWDARTEQYIHPAVIFVLTPDGTIARYLYGVRFQPGDLQAALIGAAAGEAGDDDAAAADLLACFRFDPAARAYQARIQRFLQIGAAAVFAVLVGAIGSLIWWERRRRP